MSKTRTIEIEEVGPVLFEYSNRARRINLTVKPDGRVRVAIPRGVSRSSAVEFACSQRGWLRKHLDEIDCRTRRRAVWQKRIDGLDRRQATVVLGDRLAELASLHGFRYGRLFVRNQKTRWGSCSARNNISLNMKLCLLPLELRDYVICHELVHTRIQNHGPRFWRELERVYPGARAARSLMRRYAFLLDP